VADTPPNEPDYLSNEFVAALKGESDRACAILGASLLEELLLRLFQKSLLEDAPKELFEGNGPLSTFSGRIKLAYFLGMISTDEYSELDLIRRIRNDFAHAFDHQLSFDTKPVAGRARALRFAELLAENAGKRGDKELANAYRQSLRHRFEIATGVLTHMLTTRLDHARRTTSPAGLIDAK
jgi:hypothetical protein